MHSSITCGGGEEITLITRRSLSRKISIELKDLLRYRVNNLLRHSLTFVTTAYNIGYMTLTGFFDLWGAYSHDR
jgi:hypothetical protein